MARLLLISVQLALVVLVIEEFAIESRAMARVGWLTLGGFMVHALLPTRLRLPFFVGLSFAAIGIVFHARASAWLIGLGLGIVCVCHLPVSLRVRAAILIAAGALLAILRGGLVEAPWPGTIWPILGSMFMFRLVIYFFDRSHEKESPSIWDTLSYFFLLPNALMALFPVVDYRTLRRTYYDDEDWRIYQTGVQWMLRGVAHLILYRLVYQHLVLAPAEVDSAPELVQFLVANFSLYLRVSGTFHLAIGMLHLFGFNLPETHYLFFVSSSVNDFWRRINIYWKDFMLKVFYYPAFFRLRKSGATRALVIATVYVVCLTWFLHSYQWFWLRGDFPIHWQDAAFWSTLGVLMILNSVYETRISKARGRRARTWNLRSGLTQGASIAGTFAFIVVLWSLWTCSSWSQWVSLFTFGASGSVETAAADSTGAGTLVAGLVVFGAIARDARGGRARRGKKQKPAFAGTAALTTILLLGLYVAGTPAAGELLGRRTAAVIESLKSNQLNRLDAADLQRSYYDDLLDVGRFNHDLYRLYNKPPEGWVAIRHTDATSPTGDFLEFELLPDQDRVFKGAPLTTNRWGMRDQDYEEMPPPDTVRLGVVGGSYAMGPGVRDEQVFESILEERLNVEPPDGTSRYEVLNFSVGGYFPPHRMAVVERKLEPFGIDVLLYIAHENEIDQMLRTLHQLAEGGVEVPYSFLREPMEQAGYRPGESPPDERALLRQGNRMLGGIYQRIADVARAQGVAPIWAFVPTLSMKGAVFDVSALEGLARDAGFLVIDLEGVYGARDVVDLQIAPWDLHPNAIGHRMIADRLYHELTRQGAIAPAPGTAGATGSPG